MKTSIAFFISFFLFTPIYGQTLEVRFQKIIDSIYEANPESNGLMVHVESPENNVSWSTAVGYSDKDAKEIIEPDQPALIASCTKTYVSATILRLVEENSIEIDQPIKGLISNKTRKLFESDGYVLDSISIKHLLSHTSGIADYANDEYLEFCLSNPTYRWTRDEQLELAISAEKPLAKPGKVFKYADSNYLLLTEIIEKLTGSPFYIAMRDLLRYESLELNNTWFFTLEDQPEGAKELVHQYWGDFNSLQIDVSSDLYGGGGIACTTKDLAVFSYNLFNAKIIRDTTVLNLIFSEVHTNDSIQSNYYLGLMSDEYSGLIAYGHGGFWGTTFLHFPELNTSIAVYVLEKGQRLLERDIINQIIAILNE